MMRAVWRYRIPPITTNVHLFSSGLSNAEWLGLARTWTDAALGWSPGPRNSSTFTRSRATTNDIIYDAEAVRILTRELDIAVAHVPTGNGTHT